METHLLLDACDWWRYSNMLMVEQRTEEEDREGGSIEDRRWALNRTE